MSETNGHPTLETEAVIGKDGSGIIEVKALEVDEGAGGSNQPEQDVWTPFDTIEPPENLPALSRLTSASHIRSVCLGAISRNTVGLGWDAAVWPEHEGAVDNKTMRDARHRLDALARRDRRLDHPSFSDLMYAVKHDLEEFGNGSLEASRNRRTGQIDGLYHLPGQKMRRKKDRDGWVLGQNPDLVEGDPERKDYYNFGEKVRYDASGKPQPRLQTPALGWKRNEVIAFRHYTSESRDYGLPRDIDLAVEYAAYKYVVEWTQGFFGSGGVPATVMFVQGQEERTGDRIRFTVNRNVMRRINQAMAPDSTQGKRVVVIPVPPGTSVHAEKLAQMSDRDITFGEFKKEHRRNVGSAFGLMPIFYGDVDDSGRYTAEVQRALTLEETFDPDQRYVEDRLWPLLSDLGYSELRVQFTRLAVEGDAVKRESAQNGADVGAITVGEWRKANGMGPLPSKLAPDDPENPNNERFKPTSPAGTPHDAVAVADTQDQRGLQPGVGARTGRQPPPGTVAKSDDHGEPHVEAEVEQLAEELTEYGSVGRDE